MNDNQWFLMIYIFPIEIDAWYNVLLLLEENICSALTFARQCSGLCAQLQVILLNKTTNFSSQKSNSRVVSYYFLTFNFWTFSENNKVTKNPLMRKKKI